MQTRNQKIIDAIVKKANRDCPDSLALIGIYGSFCTGDIHEKSDLDLMILVNDEKGYCLSHCFLLEEDYVAHDLYCTTWEALERDATFSHPHIAKLMDSKIVYCANEAYLTRLESLRAKVHGVNASEAARKILETAEQAYAKAMVAADLASVRYHAVGMILNCLDAIAMLNGRYYRFGTRRIFDEIDTMTKRPKKLKDLVEAVVKAETAADVKDALLPLLRAVEFFFEKPGSVPEEIYPGTCEEMLSNWRNKMYLAAETGDLWLSFSSIASLDAMLKELGFHWNVMNRFRPDNLPASARIYDDIIAEYRKEYEKAGVPFQSYPNVDAFVEAYIKKQA